MSVSVSASLGAAAGSAAAAASNINTVSNHRERDTSTQSAAPEHGKSSRAAAANLSPAELLATATSCCLLQGGAAWKTRLHTGCTAAAARWLRGTAAETGWQCLESSIVGVG